MYTHFLEAHERAVELGGLTPELRCDRAHALHQFERRVPEAESEFLAAIGDDPGITTAYVRLARLYAATGREEKSLSFLRRCESIDPLLPLLPATETLVKFWLRDFDGALEVGARGIELHPYLQVLRANYAQALEAVGRIDEALAILDAMEHIRRSEYVDPYYMALVRHAVGQRDEAFEELARTYQDGSVWLFSIGVDPKMDPLRADPRFERLQAGLYKPAPVRSS